MARESFEKLGARIRSVFLEELMGQPHGTGSNRIFSSSELSAPMVRLVGGPLLV